MICTQKGLRLNTLISKNTAQVTELASCPLQKNVLSTAFDLNSLSKL